MLAQFLRDCKRFDDAMVIHTGQPRPTKFDFNFMRQMVSDEMEEFKQAKDITEMVDALLDAVYYLLHCVVKTGIDESLIDFQRRMCSNSVFEDSFCQERGLLHLNWDELRNIARADNYDRIIQYVHESMTRICDMTGTMEALDSVLSLVCKLVNVVIKLFDLDPLPIWNLIHAANMTKFGVGGYLNAQGKWCKPPNFVAPDDAIRQEILQQFDRKKLN